ncbi:glycosyltransferase family 2 protein [Microbacterium sediminicola]|uniref:Glycosyltransferase family 2 protein n=1 Tax=Microbacterium sediminicola TaxID=415210 RepID=A0ABN2HLQ7_9MICO
MESSLSVAIVVVTYKRAELLGVLLESIGELTTKPSHVIIVDNAPGPDSDAVISHWTPLLGAREDGADRLVYAPQDSNGGGAGGFHAGAKIAYERGAEWLWFMDDDVAVLPEAIDRLQPWTERFLAIQGRRWSFDGQPFYWQYDFNTRLGIANPAAAEGFRDGWMPMNSICFEGGLVHRSIVEKIGLPDPRYFIYGDDMTYGYLASKVAECAYVDEYVLRRTRPLKRLHLGKRKLTGTSDLVRYHVMRNRGHMAHYMMLQGDYSAFNFFVGTWLSLIKELIRLFSVDRNFRTGLPALVRGMRDARRIRRDRSWQPMPPLA